MEYKYFHIKPAYLTKALTPKSIYFSGFIKPTDYNLNKNPKTKFKELNNEKVDRN